MSAFALFVLALLTLTQTLAFEEAQVPNSHTVTITSTNTALLQLKPGTGSGNVLSTASLNGGALLIDFTKSNLGFYPTATTVYPDTISYRGLFTVKNASRDAQCVRVYVPGAVPTDLGSIQVRLTGESTGVTTGPAAGACRQMPVDTTFLVDFVWKIQSTANVPLTSFNVRVEAVPPKP